MLAKHARQGKGISFTYLALVVDGAGSDARGTAEYVAAVVCRVRQENKWKRERDGEE